MGLLVPEDFDLTLLKNDSERDVVIALRDQLTDGWYIIPSLRLANRNRDHELDVVLMHRDYGIADIEVKGHRVSIREGVWCSSGSQMNPQPMEQARNNAGSLKRQLERHDESLFRHTRVRYAVAFPNTKEVEGDLPPEVREEELFLAPQIDDIATAVEDLFFTRTFTSSFTNDHIQSAINFLRPNADFIVDPEASARRSRARLESICASQVKVLERLDRNRRVIVTGGAGTGKTRLAIAWAIRALLRDERVLLTCFNEPLAGQIAGRMTENENLVVGPFLQVARVLSGMPPFEEPVNVPYEETMQFWNFDLVAHLHYHWPKVEDRFDTIIIDEAQDFSPAWIAQMEALLDPDGPRRILMVADAEQDIFDRGFTLPTAEDGWTVGELTTNCRNTFDIARLLRSTLGGSIAPQRGPESIGISFTAVDADKDTVVEAVRQAIDATELTSIAVITGSRRWRDILRDALHLGTWETRDDLVPCETERRLKGTEFDCVIVVDPDGSMEDQGLYVAISRAVNQLAIVGSPELGERLRLTNS